MRLRFTHDAHLQIGNAQGVVVYRHKKGETAEVAADVAALFLTQGVAEPVKAESAEKVEKSVKAEKATKVKE